MLRGKYKHDTGLILVEIYQNLNGAEDDAGIRTKPA
jgi:hypothetical protein